MGHRQAIRAALLDVPQALQALFHDFFRRCVFIRWKHFFDFLFQYVQQEFIYRFVAAGFSAFLCLFQQLALNLYFVRAKQRCLQFPLGINEPM